MALLHDELPRRLRGRARARRKADAASVVCRGDTVQACLTFLPTDGGEVLFAAAATEGYTAVACTLLLHADRYDADAPRLPRGCPGAATLAAAPATAVMEDFFPAAGGAPRAGGGQSAARRRRRRWRVDVLGLHARERGAGVALRGVRAAASWRRGGAAKTGRPAAGARAARRVVGR